MNHSPAPWKWKDDELFDANGKHLIKYEEHEGWWMNWQGLDEKLVEKAPEMYERLKEIADAYTKGGTYHPGLIIELLKEIDNEEIRPDR